MADIKGVYKNNYKGGVANINCKCKTFGFSWIIFMYTYSPITLQLYKYYFISLLQTKLAEKKQQTNFYMLFTLQFQIWKVL